MKPAILTFTTTGEVICLYTEIVPLSELGILHVERLSRIEFNNQAQEWEVKWRSKDSVLFSDASRQVCLNWEHHRFNHNTNE